ncbi:Ff.00g082040.m01.CDS01 [Fusarium sp. VM40]|nr:Ff.00g082040.m01.CDS01 [Fusarium sp. VM40]
MRLRSTVWSTTTPERTLDKDVFLRRMKSQWDRWAHDTLSEEESRAWRNIISKICTTNIQTIDDLAAPVYWAEVTALKVLFPNEFLQSRHAAIAQNKFPRADLNQWKPNERGPTGHPSFKKNEHVIQVNHDLAGADVAETRQKRMRRSRSVRSNDGSEDESRVKRRRLTDSNSAKEVTPKARVVKKETSPAEYETENPDSLLTGFDERLSSIRNEASKTSKISPQAISGLRHAHEQELAGQQKAHRKEIKAMKKAFQEESSALRAAYEGAISTFIEGSVSGMEALQVALQVARQDI